MRPMRPRQILLLLAHRDVPLDRRERHRVALGEG